LQLEEAHLQLQVSVHGLIIFVPISLSSCN
jgi:hypothetical protein